MAEKDEMDLRQGNPGRAWYVIHTYSGYENKVKANLERLIHTANMKDMIFNVVVPVEDEVEVKDGKKKIVPRKVFPGYVLVDMIVDEHSWYVVRNTTGVTGFVGSEKHPIPLTDEEAQRILAGEVTDKKKSAEIAEGEVVRVKSGVFEDYTGKILSIDREENRVKVDIEGTGVDVGFDQVETIWRLSDRRYH